MTDADDPRLSQLTTRWTLLTRAHAADPDAAASARDAFLPRYCAPVYRYLLGIAGDADGHVRGYVKLDRTMPRVVIFDDETWQRFGDFSGSYAPSVETVAVAQRASL